MKGSLVIALSLVPGSEKGACRLFLWHPRRILEGPGMKGSVVIALSLVPGSEKVARRHFLWHPRGGLKCLGREKAT